MSQRDQVCNQFHLLWEEKVQSLHIRKLQSTVRWEWVLQFLTPWSPNTYQLSFNGCSPKQKPDLDIKPLCGNQYLPLSEILPYSHYSLYFWLIAWYILSRTPCWFKSGFIRYILTYIHKLMVVMPENSEDVASDSDTAVP